MTTQSMPRGTRFHDRAPHSGPHSPKKSLSKRLRHPVNVLRAGTSHRQSPKRLATWVRAGRSTGGGLAWVEAPPVNLFRLRPLVVEEALAPAHEGPAAGQHLGQLVPRLATDLLAHNVGPDV